MGERAAGHLINLPPLGLGIHFGAAKPSALPNDKGWQGITATQTLLGLLKLEI